MKFPSSHAKKSQPVAPKSAGTMSLIIDIESGLVRAALVVNIQDQPPRVMYTVSSPIILRARSHNIHFPHALSAHQRKADMDAREGQGNDLLEAMSRALQDATTTIANKALPELRTKGMTLPISILHCALSSPWVISKTKTIKVVYEKDTEITTESIASIIDAEHQELEKKFKAEHENANGAQDSSGSNGANGSHGANDSALPEYDLVFIEQNIFEIKLNGYPVIHVHGKYARELEVSFAVTVSSKDILARIHDVISRTLNIVSIRGIYGVKGEYVDRYHSSLLLQYAAFRNLIKVRDDYIAAHVHNDLSDIIVVRRGVCSVLASFPFGAASFVKKSSNALGQPEQLTASALAMHSTEKLTAESSRDVADATDPIIREWADQFFKTLSMSGDTGSLPRMLVLSVHDHFPYFERALKTAEGNAGETKGKEDKEGKIRPLDITPLDEALLEKAVSYERGQDTNALVSMYAFALDPAMHAEI